MKEGELGNKRNITSDRPEIGNCGQRKSNKFAGSIELDYTELSFLYLSVLKLAKSANSQSMRQLYGNIVIKLEKAIKEIDKQVKTSTNPEFFEPGKPYDPNWMNKTDKS